MMKMGITYRTYTDTDLTELRQMMQSLYQEDSEGEPMTEEKMVNTIHYLELHPDRGHIIIILADDSIVGYAILIYYWSNECGGDTICIDELFIKKDFRSQNIGTSFIQQVMKAHQNSIKAMTVEVMLSNHKAYQFYIVLGFQVSPSRFLRYSLEKLLLYEKFN